LVPKNATFDEAVRVLIHQDPNTLDGHFHSQVDFCGGLKDTLPLFDTAEKLDPQTSRRAVGEMLRKANITSAYFDGLYPPEGSGATGHETNAARSVEDYYKSPQHVGIVVNFFYEDYNLLHIPLPFFAMNALLELNRTGDKSRLSPERLDRLLQITANSTRVVEDRQQQSLLNESVSEISSVVKEDTPPIEAMPLKIYMLAIGIITLLLILVERRRRRLDKIRSKRI